MIITLLTIYGAIYGAMIIGTKNSDGGLALTNPKLNACELAPMGILHSNSLARTTALR
jgi:hypothetical protein